ncbi:YaeQ family protein [Silvimonas amylolytica]|uniref:YaeQ family protein n=1 Tax=Silvimonas amylolytica TaxID=449663 RepID=UPI0016649F51|nr:YaeQ family protein [Silvimonas amylolytica]
MALKSTIFKAELSIADMDRGYYATHALTIAQHPSETDERMMLRLVAFARHASETLEFGRGISDEEDPSLWQRSLTEEIELWIDLGLPDEKRIKRAAQRANEAWIYAYGGSAADIWFGKNQSEIRRFDNLHVVSVSPEIMSGLAGLIERTMQLQCTIQDGEMWLSSDKGSLQVVVKEMG